MAVELSDSRDGNGRQEPAIAGPCLGRRGVPPQPSLLNQKRGKEELFTTGNYPQLEHRGGVLRWAITSSFLIWSGPKDLPWLLGQDLLPLEISLDARIVVCKVKFPFDRFRALYRERNVVLLRE
jgi:hypothetical protein